VPSFNTAIFDGPLKIYFDESQEGAALKVYFRLQEMFEKSGCSLRAWPENGQTFSVLLYRDKDSFQAAFAKEVSEVETDQLGNDFVLGLTTENGINPTHAFFERMRGIVDSLA